MDAAPHPREIGVQVVLPAGRIGRRNGPSIQPAAGALGLLLLAKGDCFAAWEQPMIFARELRAAFRPVW